MKKFAVISLHAGYWLMYLFLLLFFLFAVNTQEPDFNIKGLGFAIFLTPIGVASILPGIIGFYGFYLILFNKYLKTKKVLKLLLGSVAVCISGAIITQVYLHTMFTGINSDFTTLFFSGLFLAFISLINGIIALVMKGFITWYNEITIKSELDKKNYDMEVALIKAQINPHFLFNTINNIDVLIQKDAVKASEYLNKLSDIMRFMLYETKSEKIALTKELSYIEKYVELQRIRTTNTNYVNYEVKGDEGNLQIEPMLFIPFIENAFKHSENKKVENAIRVSFDIGKDSIRFECENAYSKEVSTKPEHSGLGNELIKRRLALLYPNKHTFETEDKNGIYKVILVLST